MNVKRKNKYNRNQSHHTPNTSLIISSDLPPNKLYNILINNPNLINEKDFKGETFLSYSIKRDKLDVLKLLLTSPILDMSFKDKDGNTYLILATLYQRENMIIPLIQKGININIKNNDGNTALHLAYMLNNENIIKILIDNNIDINIINNKGEKANEVKEKITSPIFINSIGSKDFINFHKEKDKNDNFNTSINNNDKLNDQISKYKSDDIFNTEISVNKFDDKLNNQMSKYKSDDNVNTEISINKIDETNYNTEISNNNFVNQISINKSKEEKDIKDNNDDDNVNMGLSLVKPKKKINESLETTTHNSKNNNTQINFEENDSKIKDSINDDFFDLSIELPKKENKDIVVVEKSKKDDLKDNDDYKEYNDDEMVNFSVDNFNKKSNFYKKESHSKSNIDFNNYNYSDDDDNDYNDYNDYDDNDNNNNNKNNNDDLNLSNDSNEKYDENFNPLDEKEEDFFKIKNDDEDDDYNNKSIHNKKKSKSILQSNKSIKITDIDFMKPNTNKTSILKKNTIENSKTKAITERKKNQLVFNFNQPIRASPTKNYEKNMNKNPLYTFLKSINLEKYFSNLINLGFDDINFLINEAKKGKMGITYENLKQSGINLPGDRIKILIKIQEEAKNFKTKLPNDIYYICKDLKNYKKDIHIQKLNNWLKDIKLEEYLNNFIKNGYHSKELLIMQMISKQPLTLDILENEIGITKLGHRKKILNKLNEEAYDIKNKLNSISLGDIFDINVSKTYEQVKEKCYIF